MHNEKCFQSSATLYLLFGRLAVQDLLDHCLENTLIVDESQLVRFPIFLLFDVLLRLL